MHTEEIVAHAAGNEQLPKWHALGLSNDLVKLKAAAAGHGFTVCAAIYSHANRFDQKLNRLIHCRHPERQCLLHKYRQDLSRS